MFHTLMAWKTSSYILCISGEKQTRLAKEFSLTKSKINASFIKLDVRKVKRPDSDNFIFHLRKDIKATLETHVW